MAVILRLVWLPGDQTCEWTVCDQMIDIGRNIYHYFSQYHSYPAVHAALHRIIMHRPGAKVNALKRSEV
jgi:hypothetical protein